MRQNSVLYTTYHTSKRLYPLLKGWSWAVPKGHFKSFETSVLSGRELMKGALMVVPILNLNSSDPDEVFVCVGGRSPAPPVCAKMINSRTHSRL